MATEKGWSIKRIVNTVADHLRTQGCQAKDGDAYAYRTEEADGRVLRCAVGCLIPDDLYDLGIEGATVTNDISGFPSTRLADMSRKVQIILQKAGVLDQGPLLSGDNLLRLNVLRELQSVHDCLPPGKVAEEEINMRVSVALGKLRLSFPNDIPELDPEWR